MSLLRHAGSRSPRTTPPPITPRTPIRRRPALTRDQRIEVIALRRHTDYTYLDIALRLGVGVKQVQYTCGINQFKLTPQHHQAGRPPRLMNDEAQRVIDFVKTDRTTRRMPATQIHRQLFPDPDSGIGVDAVRNCLKRAGFQRR